MDKFLKPERLDIDPSAPSASKEYLHLVKTFSNLLSSINSEEVNKLQLITHELYIPSSVSVYRGLCYL